MFAHFQMLSSLSVNRCHFLCYLALYLLLFFSYNFISYTSFIVSHHYYFRHTLFYNLSIYVLKYNVCLFTFPECDFLYLLSK